MHQTLEDEDPLMQEMDNKVITLVGVRRRDPQHRAPGQHLRSSLDLDEGGPRGASWILA